MPGGYDASVTVLWIGLGDGDATGSVIIGPDGKHHGLRLERLKALGVDVEGLSDTVRESIRGSLKGLEIRDLSGAIDTEAWRVIRRLGGDDGKDRRVIIVRPDGSGQRIQLDLGALDEGKPLHLELDSGDARDEADLEARIEKAIQDAMKQLEELKKKRKKKTEKLEDPVIF